MDAQEANPAGVPPSQAQLSEARPLKAPPWLARAAGAANRLASSKVARTLVTLAILAIAALLIRHELSKARFSDVTQAIAETPPWAIGLSVLFTVMSYGCGSVVEWYALRFIGKALPFWRTALAASGASALSIAMGFGLASGTAARLRFYAFARLDAADVAKITGLVSAAIFITGLATLGLAGLGGLTTVAGILHWPAWSVAALAVLLLGFLPGWFLLLRRWPGNRRLALTARGRVFCLVAGLGNWGFQGAALYVLTARPLVDFPGFQAAFSLGALLGSILGVPADLGVLDATVMGPQTFGAAHETAAALLLFRLIYQVGPLIIATGALFARQIAKAARRIGP